MSDSEEEYGPPLPPPTSSTDIQEVDSGRRDVIGPSLPPGLLPRQAVDEGDDSDSDIGPRASFAEVGGSDSDIGPRASFAEVGGSGSQKDPDHDGGSSDESDNDDVIGPVLPVVSATVDRKRGYDRAVRTSKNDDDGKTEKREEWMVTPGSARVKRVLDKSITSFSQKSVSNSDRPRERDRASSKKDEEVTEALKEYTKNKRSSSLMDMHSENLKKPKGQSSDKQKGQSSVKPMRLPLDFDPDKDLHVSKFDEKQKNSIIAKSKLLNTRFSKGSSSSKYL